LADDEALIVGGRSFHAFAAARVVLTNGHTGHVPRAPDFFLKGPQLAVVK